MSDIRLAPCGEGAIRVIAVHPDADERWRTVHVIADWFEDHPVDGVFGCLPTYDTLLVEFDPFVATASSLVPLIEVAAHSVASASHPPHRYVLPVVFGGERGPDLDFVAEYLESSTAEVVELLTSEDFMLRCLGGPVASGMFDGPAFSSPIHRLADPRVEVPANAISLAGVQGVIGPVKAPSGWRLIGITPVEIMDVRSETLVPYRPGDFIRLRAIDEGDWNDYNGIHLHELAEAC